MIIGDVEIEIPESFVIGTIEQAEQDTKLYRQACEELGEGATVRSIVQRAQELKDALKKK